jgi:hypothetical protein
MKTTTINIPKGTEYLSDVMETLPLNCLFNKGVPGCGGTTLALNNDIPTVVCVPFISLAHNKAIQSIDNTELYPHEVFSVNGGVTEGEFSDYLQRASVPKIMVTYDSLKRVMDQINPGEYYILIDEYHCLFTQFSFRKKAALTVLHNFKAFNSFTFMTATPLYEEFTLEELKDIDVMTASWEESSSLEVSVRNCKNGVEKTIKHQIDRIINGELEGNYYFFVNSVKFMNKMIANCHLTDDNCRVIYSDSNDIKLKIRRGKTTDEPKKINFITSCAFEGCDFYDEEGKIIIVSDSSRSNTLIDISTQFLQIAGRIRNSKYRGHIMHVLTTTRYSNKLSYDEFKEMMDENIKEEQLLVNDLENLQVLDHKIKVAAKQDLKFFRVDEEAKTIIADFNASKIDLYNYRILNSDYSSMTLLRKQYEENNIMIESWTLNTANPELIPMDDITSFENTVKELKRLGDHKEDILGNYNYMSFKSAALKAYEYLDDAIKLLGYGGIEELKYKTSDIKRKIVQLSSRTSETGDVERIAKLFQLNTKFSPGNVLTGDYVKTTMNKYYEELGINKKATSKDITTYYEVASKTKSVNGQQQRAIAIISPKIILS